MNRINVFKFIFSLFLSFLGLCCLYATVRMNNMSLLNYLDFSSFVFVLAACAYLVAVFRPRVLFWALVDGLSETVQAENEERYRLSAYVHLASLDFCWSWCRPWAIWMT